MSDDNLRAIPVAFFNTGFNFSSWEFDNLTFTLLNSIILYQFHKEFIGNIYSISLFLVRNPR